jgi:hypothetical protein
MNQQKNATGFTVRGLAMSAFMVGVVALTSSAEAKPGGKCNPKSRGSQCSVVVTNTAPTISGSPVGSVTTGQNYAFTPTASDAEGKTLTFSHANRPGRASFTSSTGKLSGTPSTSAAGEYIDIRISVSDGQASASLAAFSIVVSGANSAPTLNGTPPTSAREGLAYSFAPTSADSDGDALTFSIVNRPSWASFDTSTGKLSGTPGTGTVGSYANITIKVSDGQATVSLPAFSIDVQQASMGSATLSWQPPTTRTDGTPLTNLAGYRIRYGTALGSYNNVLTIPNGGITSAVVSDLPPATYYFVASAYDTTGAESNNSSAVSKTIN